MTAHIFGVGVGLFIIIAIWLTTLLVCVLPLRTQQNIGSVAFGTATIITLALVLIPRESETSIVSQPIFKLYDRLFVWRTLLVILLGISTVVGFTLILTNHLMEPRRAQPIKQWKL